MHIYKILIVDNESIHLAAIIDIIEETGKTYRVLQAFGGKIALRIAGKEIPDLIITDWEMPEMSGIELIKRLKRNALTRDIPVIMCTGIMLTPENLQTALEAGAFDYIRKPIDAVELEARVNSAMNHAKALKDSKRRTEEARQMQQELIESEEKYRTVVENAGDGIFIIQNGYVVFANQKVVDILGYCREVLGQGLFIEFVHQEDREKVLQNHKNKLNGQNCPIYNVRIKTQRGVYITVEISETQYSYNRKPAILNFISDITEKLRAENERKENEERYRSFFSNSREAITIFSTKTMMFLDVNDAFCKMYGYTKKESLRLNVEDVGAEVEINKKDLKNSAISSNIGVSIRYHKKKDGTVMVVSISAGPFIWKEQKVMYAILRDITEQYEMEQELKRAKDAAEVANKTKSTFLANMSHEIRTPLNAVIGFSDLLNSMITEPQHKQYLNSIKSSGNTLLGLINNILDLSKIEAGSMQLNIEEADLKTIISETQSIFSLKSSQKNIELIADIDSSTPEILFLDDLRVRQILMNLVGNAIKFTDRGYVKMSVITRNKLNDVCDLEIKIRDTGIGISGNAQKIIFDAFKQQEDQDARRYGGTGLGLAISKRLVELMGGEIAVESKDNVGSTFSINLKQIKFVSKKYASKKKADIDYTQIVFDEATVLVADDVKSNRDLINGFFKETKVEVIEAEDGRIAELLALQYIPDLIFMDIRMPIVDGFKATAIIKDNEKTKDIPIVAFTASASLDDEQKMLAKGFDGYLRKPVQRSDVFTMTAKFLKHQCNEKIIQKEAPRELPDSIKQKLPEIIHILETEFMSKYDSFSEIIDVDEVVNFGESLYEFSKKHELFMLDEFTNGLIRSANDFNFGNIKQILNSFPQIVNNLKANISKA